MRWLALLLLLLLPAPAVAERASLMLVRPPFSSQIASRHDALTWLIVQGICKQWDIDYVIVPYQSTDTSSFRHGLDANGVAHEGVVHVAWVKGRYPRSDATTLAARWPTVDTYFLGYAASTGFADAATCSTAIRSVNGDGDAFTTHMLYEVNGPAAIRSAGIGAGQAAVTPRTGGGYTGIWRPLLGVSAGIADSGMVAAGTGTIETFTRSADPDTVMAWFRQPTTSTGQPTGARIYFTQTGLTGSNLPTMDVVVYTLAKMDSSIFARTGKRLINRKVRAGMVVEKWMGTGHYGWFTSNDTMTVGPYCVTGGANCDSAQIKASLDSLGSLNVPITFAIDIDSLDYAPYQWQEVAMRTRVPKYRVAWQSHAGMIGANGANNAGAGRILDVWGHHRLRTFIPPGYSGGLNPTDFNLADCPGADSSMVCQILRADSILHARGYPVDHLVHAARDDWTPRQINRTGAGAIDTLMSIANIAHVKGFRTNVDFSIGADPGRARIAEAVPFGYGVVRTEFNVYENPNRAAVGGPGRLLTRLVTVPTRNTVYFNARSDNPLTAGHDVRSEMMWGFWTGQWYFDPALMINYIHNFQVRPLIFKINASALGNRAGAGGAPVRASLWGAMFMARNFDALNRAAGRTVAEIVPCDQLVNE